MNKQEKIDFIVNNVGVLAKPLTKQELDALSKKNLTFIDPLVDEIKNALSSDEDNEEPTDDNSSETTEKVVAERIANIEYKTVAVETAQGLQDIAVAMLPFKKIALSNGKLRFQFQFGTGLVSLTNRALQNIFEEEFEDNFSAFNAEFAGKLFPIAEDSIIPMQRSNSYTTTFNGRILESASEVLQAGREIQQQRDYVALKNKSKLNKTLANLDADTKKAVQAQIASKLLDSLDLDF